MFFVKRYKFIVIAIITFVINYGLDRISKNIAKMFLENHEPIKVIGNIFVLTFSENIGAFLSLGANWNVNLKYIIFLIIPIIICVIALVYVLIIEKKTYRIILITTIISGGIGNLFDRLLNNFEVIDFMNFGIGKLRTGILNIADLSITFGVIILIIYELMKTKSIDKKLIE